MDPAKKRRLQTMLALAATSGGVMAAAPHAQAAFCSCLAATSISSVNRNAFRERGFTPTDGWEVPLPNDEVYGYRSGTAPTVFMDFRSSESTTFFGTFCRQGFTGSVTCSSNKTQAVSAGASNHISLNVGGVHSSSNSVNDSYFARMFFSSSTTTIDIFGAATRQPRIPAGCISGCPTNP